MHTYIHTYIHTYALYTVPVYLHALCTLLTQICSAHVYYVYYIYIYMYMYTYIPQYMYVCIWHTHTYIQITVVEQTPSSRSLAYEDLLVALTLIEETAVSSVAAENIRPLQALASMQAPPESQDIYVRLNIYVYINIYI